MEPRERFLQAAEKIVEGSDDAHDRDVIEEAHPADLAQALRHLPVDQLVSIFRFLGPEQASRLLSELDDNTLIQLVQALDDVEVSRILDRMPAEHAADIVEELPAEQLDYPSSGGRLMSPDVVASTVGHRRGRHPARPQVGERGDLSLATALLHWLA